MVPIIFLKNFYYINQIIFYNMSLTKLVDDLIKYTGGIEYCDKKEIQKAIKEIEEQAIKKLKEAKDPYNVSGIQTYLDRIFELYPKCNFIPLAFECQSESSVVTSKNYYDLRDVCDNYLIDNKDICFPQADDELKIKEWNEIKECWINAVHGCNIQEGVDYDCDYCTMIHYSIYGYSKETKKIELLCDVNR